MLLKLNKAKNIIGCGILLMDGNKLNDRYVEKNRDITAMKNYVIRDFSVCYCTQCRLFVDCGSLNPGKEKTVTCK